MTSIRKLGFFIYERSACFLFVLMPQSTTMQQENKKTRFSSGSFARPFFFPSKKSSVLVTNKINNTGGRY